jgi:putative Holliday junction resolvase
MGKVLSIDFGSVRVGLAITDDDKKFALALDIVSAEPRADCLKKIKNIVDNEKVERILLGLPLTMEGTEGPQAKMVRVFGDELSKLLNLPMEYVDERFSTKMSADVSKIKGARHPDAEAARLILDAWLEKNKK